MVQSFSSLTISTPPWCSKCSSLRISSWISSQVPFCLVNMRCFLLGWLLRVPWSGVPLLAVWSPLMNPTLLPISWLTLHRMLHWKKQGRVGALSSPTEAPLLSFFESVKLFLGMGCMCVWVWALATACDAGHRTALNVDPHLSVCFETRSLWFVCAIQARWPVTF